MKIRKRQAEDRDRDAHAFASAPSAIARASASTSVSSSRSAAGMTVHRLQCGSHRLRDIEEGDPLLEERTDCDLVRRVIDARRRASAHACLARQREQGNVSASGGAELERERLREVERRHGRRGALRVRQRVGDRHAHVRVAEVRERGAVPKAHERMDDRASDGRRRRSRRSRGRTDSAPRSARGPCSPASRSRS